MRETIQLPRPSGAKRERAGERVSRGIRNNNPLNIRLSKTRWKGQTNSLTSVASGNSLPLVGSYPHSVDPLKTPVAPCLGGERDKEFVVFESPEWGFRAAFCLIRTYATKYKRNSVKEIVERWAPPSENNTQRYIQRVCEWTGFGGNQRLTEADWPKLVKAMARQETSHIYSDEVIQRGFELYRQSINH